MSTQANAGPALDPHWQARVDLAAAFRWTARLDMHEGVANHFSVAVSDDGRKFLVNPHGRHFSRVRASELLLVDADDPDTMNRPDAPEPTAWYIHGALHRNLPQARCALHVHSPYATAFSCLADPVMPPIDQNTMRFYNRLAVDDQFGGIGLEEEGERISHALGNHSVLVMGNHGVMVVGATIHEAFDELYYFERACRTLMIALASGKPLNPVSDEIASLTAQQWLDYAEGPVTHFREIRAILDVEEPDYRH
jgi:ribulose-5-phosphate 4-epimerase/fuculose-1-phosphate aldolase